MIRPPKSPNTKHKILSHSYVEYPWFVQKKLFVHSILFENDAHIWHHREVVNTK